MAELHTYWVSYSLIENRSQKYKNSTLLQMPYLALTRGKTNIDLIFRIILSLRYRSRWELRSMHYYTLCIYTLSYIHVDCHYCGLSTVDKNMIE